MNFLKPKNLQKGSRGSSFFPIFWPFGLRFSPFWEGIWASKLGSFWEFFTWWRWGRIEEWFQIGKPLKIRNQKISSNFQMCFWGPKQPWMAKITHASQKLCSHVFCTSHHSLLGKVRLASIELRQSFTKNPITFFSYRFSIFWPPSCRFFHFSKKEILFLTSLSFQQGKVRLHRTRSIFFPTSVFPPLSLHSHCFFKLFPS